MIDIDKQLAEIKNEIQVLSTKNENQFALARVIAVSKKQPVSALLTAIAAGQKAFAENYLQEALTKQAALADQELEWHFIGTIQSNKTRDIAENFTWVHTIDRIKIAKRLSEQRSEDLPPINVCLQVNIDDDPNKAGVSASACLSLAEAVSALPRVKLRGLMTILKASQDERHIREGYGAMRNLFAETRDALSSLNPDYFSAFDTLSMGMSGDWRIAVQEGATMLRIGTGIFGERTQ